MKIIRTTPERRRILFNCDGNSVFTQAEGRLEKWIQNIFTGPENSHVDALFWCDGAGGNTASYDSQVLELTGQRIGKVAPFLRQLIASGNDPPAVVVREAKKRGIDVFYSFRINDVHDDFLPEEFPAFKVEHPEWMIGPGYPNCYKTALNFALPEVRRLKFAVIEEIFRKYDFDGLEIDFMRSPPFFIPGEESRDAPILTQFLREVRNHLDRRGQERGRPVELAARVSENLQACELDGFDVKTWLRERLVDILILGSGVIDIAVEEFKRMAEGTGVLIYPCLYGWPSGYNPIPPELARGLALNYWSQGADGIYTFNWFPHEPAKAYQVDLLQEIGDPAAMRGKPMMFAADRGRPQMAYPHNWMRCVLPATVRAGQEVASSIRVGEDFVRHPPRRVELKLQWEPSSLSGPPQIQFNELPVQESAQTGSWIHAALPPASVKPGVNSVQFSVLDGVATIKAAEIHVE